MFKRSRLFWQLYPSYFLIILVSLSLVSWHALRRTGALHRSQLERELFSQAILLEQMLRDPQGELLSPEQIEVLFRQLGAQLPIRITALLADGRVVGDSAEDPGLMDNHLMRPEVQAARQGQTDVVMRRSTTVQERMLYAVVPVMDGERIAMYVRTAMPYATIRGAMGEVLRQLTGAAAVMILLAALIGFYMSRRLTRPLERVREGAAQFAQGDLAYRLTPDGSEEMASLSLTMNRMAEQLEARLEQLFRERSTRQAVFDSMTEGVLAVDHEGGLIHSNYAAVTLLGLGASPDRGVQLEALIRNAELQRLVWKAMKSDLAVEGDVQITGTRPPRLLQARGTALKHRSGGRMGALVVMQDVTRIRQLEKMRQDFVGNVSHELKTPITSIKGFVETLEDGAAEDPVARTRFLHIISRQVDQLSAIVTDLLMLASIEHQSDQQALPFAVQPLQPILEATLEVCSVQAVKRQVKFSLEVEASLSARLSPHLFEQALVNLIDNAVKYSASGSTVTVRAHPDAQGILVEVRDEGSGIEQRHLERLFERFYRVDKGRSREFGGTGLGLSIVKHIAAVHGGRVSVESELGKGSVFRIHLPA